MTINPYLNFNGKTEEAFKFYQSVFGGEFEGGIMRFGSMPPGEHGKVDASEADKVMHVSLPIGNGISLMGSDTPAGYPAATAGSNMHININLENKGEADRIFNALGAGGQITMPLADTFWGSYFGMLVDKFGISWMMSCNSK